MCGRYRTIALQCHPSFEGSAAVPDHVIQIPERSGAWAPTTLLDVAKEKMGVPLAQPGGSKSLTFPRVGGVHRRNSEL
jgi:hypothetical protein